jgi:transcriptional regulator with XRE-family HTH domain
MLGENIKKIRETKNITQKALAKKAGLSARTIQHYEQETRYPRYDQMKDIAKALEVSLIDILMLEGNVEINTSDLFMSKLLDEIEEHEWELKEIKDKIRWKLNLLKEIERITGKQAINFDDTNFYIPGEDDIPFKYDDETDGGDILYESRK